MSARRRRRTGRGKPERARTKIERRWLRQGGCVACGRPRALVARPASWGRPRSGKRTRRRSKRFCRRHLILNRRYQVRARRRAA